MRVHTAQESLTSLQRNQLISDYSLLAREKPFIATLVFCYCAVRVGLPISCLLLKTFFISLKRKRKRLEDEEDNDITADGRDPKTVFKHDVFNVILDSVIGDISVRFESVHSLCDRFSVLWSFKEITPNEIQEQAGALVQRYPKDLGDDLSDELQSLKLIFSSNFGDKIISPIDLLNKIKTLNLETLFPNLSVALRIFATIPATVASAERSFSVLNRVKNVLRSTICVKTDCQA